VIETGSIGTMAADARLQEQARSLFVELCRHRYSYHFDWLGRPIIQFPQDVVAMQEVIWRTRPDVIVETGIAHGGSLVMSASMLALLDLCDAAQAGAVVDPARLRRRVIGVDIDIRTHNREAIERHPLSSMISMIQGSSIDPDVVGQVRSQVGGASRVMVCLDSNHTHGHVLEELRAYAPLTTPGCYCVVLDTVVEHMPKSMFPDRPWGPGDNPLTAVHAYLREDDRFEIDSQIADKLVLTVAPDGWLERKR
jgi:cephalosporin hydroxylase